jgi:hypothetical protein
VTGGLFLYKFAEFEICSFKYKQILLKFKILSGGLGPHSVVPRSAHADMYHIQIVVCVAALKLYTLCGGLFLRLELFGSLDDGGHFFKEKSKTVF